VAAKPTKKPATKKPKNAAPRKPPPALPPPSAAAFVTGAQAGRSSAQASSSTTITRVRSGATLRRLTVYLPEDMARAARVRCAQEDRTLSDVVQELTGEWLTAAR